MKRVVHSGLAALWGIVFIRLYRWLMDFAQPFTHFSITLFGLMLAFLAGLAYFVFFQFHFLAKKRGIFYSVFLILLGVGFLFFWQQFRTEFFYLYPAVTLGSWILLFIVLVSRLPFFVSSRIALSIGILLGLISKSIHISEVYLWELAILLALIPNRWLRYQKKPILEVRQKMPYLRFGIDFIRIFSFVYVLSETFVRQREKAGIAFFILILGFFLAAVILRFDKKKHHIRFGISLLGFFLALAGLAWFWVEPVFLLASIFSTLTLWEALYWRKVSEGYILREQLLTLLIFSLFILSEFFHWHFIILNILMVIVLVLGIWLFLYASRKVPAFAAVIWFLGLSLWGASSYSLLFHSPYEPKQQNIQADWVSSLPWLPAIKEKKVILSNVIIPSLCKQVFENKQCIFIQPSPFVLFATLQKELKQTKPDFLFLDMKKYRPYEKGAGKKVFLQWIQKNYSNSCLLLFRSKPYFCRHEIKKQNLLESLSNQEQIQLAEYLQKNGYSEQALNILKAVASKNFLPIPLLNQAWELAAKSARVDLQIYFAERILAQGGVLSLKQKQALMELYYTAKEYDKSLKMVNELLLLLPEKKIPLLRWKFRIIATQGNAYKMQAFYQRLHYQSISPQKKPELEKLKKEVEAWLRQNPDLTSHLEKEWKRWEKIRFPE
ncbi:MAG: hypothetical protein D6767_07585 [Candidatus Hydrogenedentota bacterium]|nr:MAG: hypothetical protein D6767_07585 [Candidatus Hydrogenedentota bacterium]